MKYIVNYTVQCLGLILVLAESVYSRHCDNPWKPLQAIYNFTGGSSPPGTIIGYICYEGYKLVGSPVRICQNNGTWMPELPVCESQNLTCGHPGHGDHAFVNLVGNSFLPGTLATYRCDLGYVLVGPEKRLCQTDGKWSYPEPYCAAKLSMHRRIARVSQNVDVNEESFRQGFAILDDLNSECSEAQAADRQTSSWTVDLLEIQKVDVVILIFQGSRIDLNAKLIISLNEINNTIIDPSMYSFSKWSGPVGTRDVTTYEYSLLHKTSEFRYITIEMEPSAQSTIRLCQILVLSKRGQSFGQCLSDVPGVLTATKSSSSLFHGKCYSFIHDKAIAWDQAARQCEAINGSLVTDVNMEVQNLLTNSLKGTLRQHIKRNYWIGGIGGVPDSKGRYAWVWRNNKDIDHFFWGGKDEPNVVQKQRACISLAGTFNWQWDDQNCNNKLFYICQHGIQRCASPEQPEYTEIEFGPSKTDVGSKIVYKCPEGFRLQGSNKERLCLETGHWSGHTPFCLPTPDYSGHKNYSPEKQNDEKRTQIGTGVIIGIVIAAIIAVLLVIAVVIFMCLRKHKSGIHVTQCTMKQTESAETLDIDTSKKGSNYSTIEK